MLGKQLKLLRETAGKSQLEVCSALNIEQSTLANYENDKRIPKLEILIKLAEYYKVSVDCILGLEKIGSSRDCYDYFYEDGLANWNIRKKCEELGNTGFFTAENLNGQVSGQKNIQVVYDLDTDKGFGGFDWHIRAEGKTAVIKPVSWIRKAKAVSEMVKGATDG